MRKRKSEIKERIQVTANNTEGTKVKVGLNSFALNKSPGCIHCLENRNKQENRK